MQTNEKKHHFIIFIYKRQKASPSLPFITVIHILLRYLYPHKIGSRLCRAVEISRVAEFTPVEIALETVQYVLNTCINLKVYMITEYECIAGLDVQVTEMRCCLHAVTVDISGIVRDNH